MQFVGGGSAPVPHDRRRRRRRVNRWRRRGGGGGAQVYFTALAISISIFSACKRWKVSHLLVWNSTHNAAHLLTVEYD